MDPIISVIVPVYNEQDVLNETMGNLIYQSMFDTYGEESCEILLIDDRSTDNTPYILDDLERQFLRRLRVIHLEENLGPGGAKNVGMDHARGQFVGFVDCDDIVDVTFYERLYETATQGGFQYDFVDSPVYYEESDQAILVTPPELAGTLDAVAKCNLLTNVGYLFTRLIRREFLEKYHLRTREHIKSEDEDFIAEIICRAETMNVYPQALYVRKNRKKPRGQQEIQEDMVKPFSALVSSALSAYNRLTSVDDYEAVRAGAETFYLTRLARALQLYEVYHNAGLMSEDFDAQILLTVRRAAETVVQGGVEDNPYAMATIGEKDRQRLSVYLDI